MPAFDSQPLQLSLWVALGALLLCFPLGVLAARAMSGRHFPFKDWIEGALLLPLVLPPVVTGFALLVLLGRRGPLGDLRLLFTPWAAILASAIVAFPLVYQSARAAFMVRGDELEMVARCLGASRGARVLDDRFAAVMARFVGGRYFGVCARAGRVRRDGDGRGQRRGPHLDGAGRDLLRRQRRRYDERRYLCGLTGRV